MGHPDSGLMLALLDGEVTDPEAHELRAHLAHCIHCRKAFQSLASASRETAEILSILDSEPRTRDVKDEIRERVSSRTRPSRFPSLSLPRAASIALLLTGGAAAALPGSPIRRWVVEGWETLTGPEETVSVEEPDGAQEREGASGPMNLGGSETGAGIPAGVGSVEVWIHDLPAEAQLRILWTDAEDVWVFGGQGTRFNRDGQRLEAFTPPGGVRVEIPRSLEEIVVRLDGNVLLRKSGGEVEIVGQVQQRTPSEIRFDTPGSVNDAPS